MKWGYCEVGSLLKYICYLFHISHISTHFSCKVSFVVLILSSYRAGLIFYRVGVKGINKKTGKDILYFFVDSKNVFPSTGNSGHSTTFGSAMSRSCLIFICGMMLKRFELHPWSDSLCYVPKQDTLLS